MLQERTGCRMNQSRVKWGVGMVAVALACSLTACGGGSLDVEVAAPFDIDVTVGGRPLGGVHIGPGMAQTIMLPVGQSIALDASEPVVWSLRVGGTVVTGAGATVDYGGVSIRQTTLTASRILIDTYSDFPLGAPLSFSLVATSMFDAAQVANIRVVLVN